MRIGVMVILLLCTVGGVSAGELFVAPSGRLTDAVADGSRSRPFVSLT